MECQRTSKYTAKMPNEMGNILYYYTVLFLLLTSYYVWCILLKKKKLYINVSVLNAMDTIYCSPFFLLFANHGRNLQSLLVLQFYLLYDSFAHIVFSRSGNKNLSSVCIFPVTRRKLSIWRPTMNHSKYTHLYTYSYFVTFYDTVLSLL